MTFRRTALAQEMAQQLLRPSFLDTSLRSGLFLSGQRRVGKTTFLASDLIPALEECGAIVIYVDLWSQPQANPADLVHDAIRKSLDALQTPGSGVLQKLKRVTSIDAGAAGFKFGFKLADVGKEGGVSLAHAFTELIEQAQTDVVLIVDEVQQALGSADGDSMLHALKATCDAINTRPDTPGYFLFVGTGSHRARVQELSIKGNQAFNGAVTHDFPVLGRDFIEYVLQQVAPQLATKVPSIPVTEAAFKRMGSRPEELMKALSILRGLPPGADADEHLPTIAESLGAAAADVELQKIEALGPLAAAIFSRFCHIGGNVRGGFTADTLSEYSAQIGREITAQEVQSVIGMMTSANLLMRVSHGHYGVTDSFVEQAWMARLHTDGLLPE
ncbi:AAA family ATPase [Actimicrobium sp. CCI2.3]|uniref:AAA family ATPase n=1 Tax=Actimicrobium sp. CCI2.3 TaxID=3048616 RepID=UPI002AB4D120|nr:AAA family ATPase [Actimicrobium sp. CCI2.3]MDY7576222.1 ATP-binding protein [Actimicrobium sp. CCI2.3]MEB0020573.1 ATP-binding protein [Actimicrobium sp. CCI2.3]